MLLCDAHEKTVNIWWTCEVNSKACGHIFSAYSDLTSSIRISALKNFRHVSFGRSFFGILSKDIRD